MKMTENEKFVYAVAIRWNIGAGNTTDSGNWNGKTACTETE